MPRWTRSEPREGISEPFCAAVETIPRRCLADDLARNGGGVVINKELKGLLEILKQANSKEIHSIYLFVASSFPHRIAPKSAP